jgi:serine/threonine protein kinase
MEYVDGGNLLDWINKRKRRTNEILHIFKQIVIGLQYIHSKNILHRDLKPENILLTKTGIVKITDFGLSAYLEGEGQGKDYLLGGKTIVGTASYGPPEIVFYENKYGIACDIFSLGYTIFELMNFGLPTETKNGNRNLVRLNNQDGFYDFYLADLVDRMYEHESYKRPTAKQCLARLNEIDNSINKFNNQFNNNNFMNNNMNNNFINNNMNNNMMNNNGMNINNGMNNQNCMWQNNNYNPNMNCMNNNMNNNNFNNFC